MIHKMKLFGTSFDKIKNNSKDIEVRLYDEKRKTIHVGDKIIFYKLPENNETITTEVTGLSIFSNFNDLLFNFDCSRFGHHNLSKEEQLANIKKIYSKEQEKEHGVIGIHLKLNFK